MRRRPWTSLPSNKFFSVSSQLPERERERDKRKGLHLNGRFLYKVGYKPCLGLAPTSRDPTQQPFFSSPVICWRGSYLTLKVFPLGRKLPRYGVGRALHEIQEDDDGNLSSSEDDEDAAGYALAVGKESTTVLGSQDLRPTTFFFLLSSFFEKYLLFAAPPPQSAITEYCVPFHARLLLRAPYLPLWNE